MARRKSKLSIIRWFCHNIAIVLGIIPQTRRSLIKRYNRKMKSIDKTEIYRNMNLKTNAELNHSLLVNNNNNNNRSFDNRDININGLSEINQRRRIICILVENQQIAESIEYLLTKNASILKNSSIIDFQELVQFIQSSINIPQQDASTMTNTDQICCSIAQSENARRLKALEFIRIFIEKNEEDFCQYLINKEHLCQQKTLTIYQMIKQFLNIVYRSE